jgi:hypothetical protein
MPARSKKQQMAAGAALAAKRGERSKSSLKGGFERNVQVDDQETAARVRKNQTQKIAEKKRR